MPLLPAAPDDLQVPPPRAAGAVATLDVYAFDADSYLGGAIGGNVVIGSTVEYQDASHYVWYTAEELAPFPNSREPIRLRVGERLDGAFPQPTVTVDYYDGVGIEAGDQLAIHDELDPVNPLATARHVSPRYQDGVVSYRGATLFNVLQRVKVRNSVIRDGPFTARRVLAILLNEFDIPNIYGATQPGNTQVEDLLHEELPELFLFTDRGAEVMTLRALLLEATEDESRQENVLEVLRRFFGMFPDYHFRANSLDEFMVVPPPYYARDVFVRTIFVGTMELPVRTEGVRMWLMLRVLPPVRQVLDWRLDLMDGDSVTEDYVWPDSNVTTFTVSLQDGVFTLTIAGHYETNEWEGDFNLRGLGEDVLDPPIELPESELGETLFEDEDTDGILTNLRLTSQGVGEVYDQTIIPARDFTRDYDSSNPPRNPVTGGVITRWQDDQSRTSLFPGTSPNEAPSNYVEADPDIIIVGSVVVVNWSLEVAWTVWPYELVWLPGPKWRTPEGYPRPIRVDGDWFSLPHSAQTIISTNGTPRRVNFRVSGSNWPRNYHIDFWVEFRWRQTAESSGLEVTTGGLPGSSPDGGHDSYYGEWVPWLIAGRFTAEVFGTTVTRVRDRLVAVYSENDDPDVSEIAERFGSRGEELDLGPYAMDMRTLQDLARSIVTRRMYPAVRRTMQIMPPYVLRPDHLGQYVVVEDGNEGVLIERVYSEDNGDPVQKYGECLATIRMTGRQMLRRRFRFGDPDDVDMIATFDLSSYGNAPYGEEE